MPRFLIFALSVVLAGVAVSGAMAHSSSATGAAVAAPWKNCTQVNGRYPHGVGRLGARDHTGGPPVTTFKRSDALYRKAMSLNRSLDRDRDGIACESA